MSMRSRLFAILLVAVLALGGIMAAIAFIGTRGMVRSLSADLIDHTLAQTELRLNQFFEPVIRELQLACQWGNAGLLDTDNPDALNTILAPLINEHPQISSALVADSRGREHMLLRSGDKWMNRQTRHDQWGSQSRILEWRNGEAATERYADLGYDPRLRPWYQGAIARHAQQPANDSPLDDNSIHWTEPYIFFTTKEAGITASVVFDPGDGHRHVVGFDVLLSDISAFTTQLNIQEHGMVVVLTGDNRIVGLPRYPRFLDAAARNDALLRSPRDLGIPLATDATNAFTQRPPGDNGALRFRSEGQAWWGQAKTFQLNNDMPLVTVVLVPEVDLLGKVRQMLIAMAVMIAIVLAIAFERSLALSRHLSRPIEAIAEQNERISRGNLDPGPPVLSDITEIRRLAGAQEQMRHNLQSLMKLERDLQLARQIQQNTFPDALPRLAGYDISAWSDPAEETGGDSYDVVGFRRRQLDGPVEIDVKGAHQAAFLLADATGHGVGPAISVAQVRAMLRMAVRTGTPLAEAARHLNEQLVQDLREGRFVTAWLGTLDAKSHVLDYFSAGQAPLLHYRHADKRFVALDADAPPLGILADLEIRLPKPVELAPGDIFVVCSDGIYDLKSRDGAAFGRERVEQLILDQRGRSAAEMMNALRAALAEFGAGAQVVDDRTAILIKRTA